MLATHSKRDSNLIASLANVDRSSTAYRAVLAAVLLVTVALVFYFYMSLFEWEPNPWHGLSYMLAGTAWKPYVTRALIPLLTRLIVSILPVQPEFVATGWMLVSFVGFVFAFRYLLAAFWRASVLSDALTVFAIVGLLPLMATFSQQMYDFATLFFFTLELGLLARRQWKWFLAIFPLACLNRETTFLLSLVFAVHYYPLVERRFLIKMLAAQGLIFVALRAPLLWLFKDNPGNAVEVFLPVQLYVLRQIFAFSAIGLLALLFVVCGVGILALMLYRWNDKPPFLREAALVTVPLLVVSYLVFGLPFEIRVFYEGYPVVFLLCVEPIYARLDHELQAATTQRLLAS
jgi:hypothetical protein